jgi:hypothetical protein
MYNPPFLFKKKYLYMLDKLNNILIILEDAMDTESWDLVKSAHAKLEELYERMEMEDTFGSDEDY